MGGKPLPRASRFGSRGKCGVALHKTRAKPSRTQQREGRDGAEEAGGRRDPRGGDGVNLQRPRPAGGPVTRPRRKMEAALPTCSRERGLTPPGLRSLLPTPAARRPGPSPSSPGVAAHGPKAGRAGYRLTARRNPRATRPRSPGRPPLPGPRAAEPPTAPPLTRYENFISAAARVPPRRRPAPPTGPEHALPGLAAAPRHSALRRPGGAVPPEPEPRLQAPPPPRPEAEPSAPATPTAPPPGGAQPVGHAPTRPEAEPHPGPRTRLAEQGWGSCPVGQHSRGRRPEGSRPEEVRRSDSTLT